VHPEQGDAPAEKCLLVNRRLIPGGLFTGEKRSVHPDSNAPWRISPEPFWITQAELEWFEALGHHLLAFYQACNLLYSQSVRGIQPAWIADCLDRGKDDVVVGYGRMNRFKNQLPLVIRPDVIPTDEGIILSELDSVPGGIGFTGYLSRLYAQFGDCIVGGADGIVHGFAEAIRALARKTHPHVAIVVSDEAGDYREEMAWLAEQLTNLCLPARAVHPRDVHFHDERGVSVSDDGPKVDVLYRFFELFDVKNIPKSELFLYAAKKNLLLMTPPPKAYLEEKALFALLHHPLLSPFWERNLPEGGYDLLRSVCPQTWVLDPRPVPPHAVISGLIHRGLPVQDFRTLADATQRERELVIKPSGFSERAWGSRGVVVGHDRPADEWAAALERALADFQTTPHVLQRFHSGRRYDVSYYDFEHGQMRRMSGRARLTPYYFVVERKPKLAGILATVCPADKKILHGMVEAVMVPCAVACL
jgi:hypothetical protein